MAAAVGLWTHGGSTYHSAAMAIRAGIKMRDAQAHHRAADRVPETDVDLIFKVRPVLRLVRYGCACAAASAKHAGENIAEPARALPASSSAHIGEIKSAEIKTLCSCVACSASKARARATAAAACVSFCRGGINVVRVKSQLIVDLALLGIAQNVIGLRDFFKLLFGLFVIGIYVRMVLSGELTERLADLFHRGSLLYAQCAVIIFLCSRHSYLVLNCYLLLVDS